MSDLLLFSKSGSRLKGLVALHQRTMSHHDLVDSLAGEQLAHI